MERLARFMSYVKRQSNSGSSNMFRQKWDNLCDNLFSNSVVGIWHCWNNKSRLSYELRRKCNNSQFVSRTYVLYGDSCYLLLDCVLKRIQMRWLRFSEKTEKEAIVIIFGLAQAFWHCGYKHPPVRVISNRRAQCQKDETYYYCYYVTNIQQCVACCDIFHKVCLEAAYEVSVVQHNFHLTVIDQYSTNHTPLSSCVWYEIMLLHEFIHLEHTQ